MAERCISWSKDDAKNGNKSIERQTGLTVMIYINDDG
jgi:hypothetical protein